MKRHRETYYQQYRQRTRDPLSFDGWLDVISDAADEAEMTIDELLEMQNDDD